MAKKLGVWGIDIGQCALKALRCTEQDGQIVADAFDFIEYPKILSQPEADPAQLVRDAMEQFCSRNELKGYSIAMSVPGQSGLAKFFKPPPVDPKKVPDIVKFEARQQIPFALEDVVWDYQMMGGKVSDGIAMDTEVGLFAMKRDQVYRSMGPFREVDVEVDTLQLAPLSVYNFVCHDLLDLTLTEDEYDPDDPPESLVVLAIGTETTDLVITNGYRMWQRSIPLGGNHFTKQLTKELKLTFAKAEHLKRNARQAEDPKAVFKAMRPVFNDLVTEIQRSIGYFQGRDRKAKLKGAILLGNTTKLPGLNQFLGKNLGFEVLDFGQFKQLQGTEVLAAPAFKDNVMSFGVCYGLCLQGLEIGRLQTNLVPREILTERLIRAKKPWAVASLGALLLACTFNVAFRYGNLRQVAADREVNNVKWSDASLVVSSAKEESDKFQSLDSEQTSQLNRTTQIGEELVGNADRRLLWPEMMHAVSSALPRTPGIDPLEVPDVDELKFEDRRELYIEEVETQYFPQMSKWYTDNVKRRYRETLDALTTAGVLKSTTQATPDEEASTDDPGPEGPGWVVQLKAYHLFNKDRSKQGPAHVYETVITNLMTQRIALPAPVHKLIDGVLIRQGDEVVRIESIDRGTVDVDGKSVRQYTLNVLPVQLSSDGKSYEDKPGAELATITKLHGELVDVDYSMEEIGITRPIISMDTKIDSQARVPNPKYVPGTGEASTDGAEGYQGSLSGAGGAGATLDGGPDGDGGEGDSGAPAGDQDDKPEEPQEPAFLVVPKYTFEIQFCWQEVQLSERLEKQSEAAKAYKEKKREQALAGSQDDQAAGG